ncbi:MAG: hypothetical protein JWM47_2489 [Acidimicrobiales bacterium]|nr:hypothetical protein [Acidimicrobiales bacterium]
MSQHDELLAEPGNELALMESQGVVVLQGPRDLVERFVSGDPTMSRAREVPPSSVAAKGAAGSLASLLTSVLGGGGGHQVLFQLDDVGMAMYEQGNLVAKGDGFVRLFGKGVDGKISAHGALKPISTAPQQVLSAQMALTTLALTAAIKEVQAAVERVEDKLDVLRDLLDAERVGQIVGAHRSLTRRADKLGFDGSMADADWHSIDDVGIQVEQQIESLRSFVRKRLLSAEGKGDRIDGRRDALDDVRELSEALALLVVAQNSLFTFQQLRLARIRDTEPGRLEGALSEAHELIDQHREEDIDLLHRVRAVVDERIDVKALEIHRFMTVKSLVAGAEEVDSMLAWFAAERTLSYTALEMAPVPGISDAAQELRERGSDLAGEGRQMLTKISHRVRSPRSGEELQAGEVAPGLGAGSSGDPALAAGDAGPDAAPAASPELGRKARIGRLRSRVSEKVRRDDDPEGEEVHGD